MPPQEVRKFVFDEPFVPFRLHVTNGSSYEVLRPSEIQVFPLQVSIAIDPDDSGLYRSSVRVAPNHITRIEFLPSARKPRA
ncbi:MAG TPA: hypothetical protein VF624_06540 [Tepidisphaeraceae bacterium]|jgi:hypothetical protein